MGYFKLDRDIEYCWVWEDKPFSKGQAWIDLILLANYRDEKMAYKGKIITCERGTVNFSIQKLSQRWGWSREKTRNFLTLLEADKMATINATRHRTTITIENYNKYQDMPSTNTTTNQSTNRQQTSQPTDIINKINKVNKEKEKINKKEKEKFGEFENVKLTADELEKLKEKFPYNWQEWIERLSLYIKSKGDKYKSHYATILNWAKKETIQDLSPQAKQKRSEALRKQREAEQKAEDERDTEEWYKEKMKQYGVGTREELDEILKEQQRVAKEKLKNIGGLF